jgi:hypothetical protein
MIGGKPMPPNETLDHMGQLTDAQRIVFADKRNRIEFDNDLRRTVRKIDLDDEQLPQSFGLRCDGILVGSADLELHEHYVELKGSDIGHAVAQLTNTLVRLSRNPTRQRKSCHVISARIPKAGTDIQIAKVRFLRQYAAFLNFKTRGATVRLS